MNNKIKHTHSIRKYKIGAASVVLGMIIFLANIGTGDAQAAEVEKDTQTSPTSKTEMHTNLKNETVSQPALNTSTQVDKSTQNQVTTEQNMPNTAKPTDTSTHVNKDNATPKVKPQDKQHSSTSNISNSSKLQKNNTSQPKANGKNVDTLKKSQSVVDKRNISSKVTVRSAEIKVDHSANADKSDTKHVNPHKGDKLKLKYQWQLGKDVQSGDYVDVYISQNVNTKGVVDNRTLPNIKEGTNIVAIGKLIDNHKFRYTFTDYVTQRTNIKATLNLDLYINRQNVPNEGKQTVTATIGSMKTERNINVKYDQGVSQKGVKVNGTFSHINPEKKTFEHITFVTSETEAAKSGLLSGMLVHGQVFKGDPSVKIYEYIGKGTVNPSLSYNLSNGTAFKDVTYLFDGKLFKSNHGYNVEMTPLNRQYVIVFNGTFNENANTIKFETQLLGFKNPITEEKVAHVAWSNQINVFKDNVTGSGSATSDIKDAKMEEEKNKEQPKGEEKQQPKPENDNKMTPKDKENVPMPQGEMNKPTPEKDSNQHMKPEHKEEMKKPQPKPEHKDEMKKPQPKPEHKMPMPEKDMKSEKSKGSKMKEDHHMITPPTVKDQSMMKPHRPIHAEKEKNRHTMLPETGQSTSTEPTTLLGVLLAFLGLTAFIKRRKDSKN